MKAAVCYEFGQPMVVEGIEIDPPKYGEVKVRMAATAICHSDVHIIRGEWGGKVPLVAGHEGAGIVKELGPGVTLVREGDPVVVTQTRWCGRCLYCSIGEPQLCEGKFALQSESRLRNHRGESIQQAMDTAAFAEYVIVDQSQLVPIPKTMPLDSAALLACGVITGYGAVVNRAQIPPNSSVVVIGVGGVGLNSVQGARLSGAAPIIATDIQESKLAVALAFGATHTVDATGDDVMDAVSQITGGRLADYVFVTVGSVAAAEQAYALAGKRGTIVFVGVPDWSSSVPIPIGETVANEKTVTGSLMGSSRFTVDIPKLIALYEAGRFKLDELITARYPLEQINEAIEVTASGKTLRNVIVFDWT